MILPKKPNEPNFDQLFNRHLF